MENANYKKEPIYKLVVVCFLTIMTDLISLPIVASVESIRSNIKDFRSRTNTATAQISEVNLISACFNTNSVEVIIIGLVIMVHTIMKLIPMNVGNIKTIVVMIGFVNFQVVNYHDKTELLAINYVVNYKEIEQNYGATVTFFY